MTKWAATLVAGAALASALPGQALAWGALGHTEIGNLAWRMLAHHANAQAHVRALLGEVTLGEAGPWADCLRGVKPSPTGGFVYDPGKEFPECKPFENEAGEAAMIDYVSRNWSNCALGSSCHTNYHFINLAIQRDGWTDGATGTADYDVEHALEAAIAVLEGKPAPAPFDFNEADALRLLVHFIGDAHQPLHVCQNYLDAQGHVVDPDEGPDKASALPTFGSNFLVWLVGNRTSNLHSEWDGVDRGDISIADARKVAPTTGPVDDWPKQWVTDTFTACKANGFTGVSFGARRADRKWEIAFGNRGTYVATRKHVQRLQIEKAAARLAQVLLEIWPDEAKG